MGGGGECWRPSVPCFPARMSGMDSIGCLDGLLVSSLSGALFERAALAAWTCCEKSRLPVGAEGLASRQSITGSLDRG